MSKLKVVSIGGFGHSVFVFDDMLEMAEAQLVGFAPAFEGESLSIVTNHQIYNDKIKQFDDYRKMLAEIRPDVAIISTRLDKIAAITIEAANAGCNLICEKPLALSHTSLKKVYKAVKENNAELFAMHSMRSEGAFITAHNLCRSGEIGEVVLANGRKSYKWGTRPDWFADRETYGGTICWVGIHALDFIHYITGLEFRSVMVMQGNFAHPDFKDCEDNCAFVLEMSNTAHATVSVDLLRPSFAPTHGDDWVRIVGTKGIIEANASKGTCNLITETKGPADIPVAKRGKMFRNFLLSLSGKAEYAPELTTRDAFMLTHVCLCARDAADTGKKVGIEEKLWD
ncbi:MAG: Gfo/Idh/MocA family oxidoreductase [Sedimentisphaerales bacterium]|nr:Gfo/Idh/MocA family oxidoreductase [Sedimentisphaerales bacterium]